MNSNDEDRDVQFKSRKILYDSDYVMERAEKVGFGMVVRANHHFPLIVKDYFERHPKDTCLIYSMWSGYIKKFPNIKQLIDYAGDNLIWAHVSGHVTKEDLERAIDIVRPEKVIIHHTNNTEEELDISISYPTYIVYVNDGEDIKI